MSAGWGAVAISARRMGPRTILERVRYDGISRCSRAFAHGDAALVVLSQLGPGVVRGDAVTTSGRAQPGAHLIVTSQTATRLMGGARRASSHASWSVDAGALLELIAEPLIANADARYDGTTIVELGPAALVLSSELVCVRAGADVRLRTCVRRGGGDLFYDALDAAAVAPSVVGTLALVGIAAEQVALLVAALDRQADGTNAARIGIGALPCGAFARVLGDDVWTVQNALRELRESAWRALKSTSRA